MTRHPAPRSAMSQPAGPGVPSPGDPELVAAGRAGRLPGSPFPIDSLGMWEATMSLPEQVRVAAVDARQIVAEVDPARWRRKIANVVVLGMGGSGVAGDVLRAIAGPRLPVPAVAVKSYTPPRFVGSESLVFAVSCSGETEETIEAAAAAWDAGANVVVIAGGGTLGQMAEERGSPLFGVPEHLPQPRTALGAMAVPPLVVLDACGLLQEAENLVGTAADQLARRRDELCERGDPADRIARAIGRTIPLFHGGDGAGAVAAARWKTQVNENVKAPAFTGVQPELCHNEVAGWGQYGDVTRQVLTLVTLRCSGDHPQVARRTEVVKELLVEVVHEVIEVWGAGETDLAQLLDLVLIGDVVSLVLAAREGIDPGPVPVLGEIKERLRS